MNQRSTGLSASKALTGFLHYKTAEGLAPVTVVGYARDLKLWIEYQGDIDIGEIHSQHIVAFLSYLRTDYVPRRIAGDKSRNYDWRVHPHILLRAGRCRTNKPSSAGKITANSATSTPARIFRLFIPSLITTPGRTGAMKTTIGIAVSMIPAVNGHLACLLLKAATRSQPTVPISTGQMKE